MNLGIVVPCYNEEEVLPLAASRLGGLLQRLERSGMVSPESRIYFVDDGSRDRTWAVIRELAARDARFAGIRLSRNRGHQNALLAGLFTAPGDVLISIDADLQDDVDAIERMLREHLKGADVVYGVRRRRDTDSFFKRFSAQAFYRLIAALGAESVYNHADYRLLSRRALEALRQYREVNLFLRGIVPLIGYPSAIVEYDRAERAAGTTKYPLRRMIGLALEAVTSFSVVPLRIISLAGFLIFAGTIGISLWVLWIRFVTGTAVPGWASVVLPMYFLGGIQIFCIGMLGEYLGKVYSEVKGRPRFFMQDSVNLESVQHEAAPGAVAAVKVAGMSR